MANALDSLYGEGHANATRTRECVAMPGMRNQEILTPPTILAIAWEMWGHIVLDPCAPVGSNPVGALMTWDGVVADGKGGAWPPKTYCNPPYGDLKAWLAHAAETSGELLFLCPVRTHREWWCRYVGLIADRIAWLRPVKFIGYEQAFPAPLALLYRGGHGGAFDLLASHLGWVTENCFR